MEKLNKFQPLLNGGVMGAVLWWFMTVAADRLDRLEVAINRQSRAVVMLTLALPERTTAATWQATELGRELGIETPGQASIR